MVTIHYSGKLEKIKAAVISANTLLTDLGFYQAIAEQKKFDMSDVPPQRISELIQESNIKMRVLMYIASPRVHGYDDINNPDLIHVNVFRSDWTISGIVNTIIHQVVHAVDDQHRDISFGHGDRSSTGKENTAPYWIASTAERMLTGKAGTTGLIHEAPPESLALDTFD